jgi:hypothetical protein
MTEFSLGARASCSDGFCGEVRRTILDPAARTVTHLVIAPRHRKADARLVPVELADAAGGEITLRCTLAEFDRLDPAEEVDAVEAGFGDGSAAMGFGDPAAGLGPQPPIVVSHAVPLGETEVGRHESVHAVDGEIGRVAGFVVDPADHQLTHILLKEGHLWGRKEVAIPVSAVASLDAGIRLNITKKQVEDLPPLGQGHP